MAVMMSHSDDVELDMGPNFCWPNPTQSDLQGVP